MSGYTAGSVTAKITIDTSEWNKVIKNLKEDVKELRNSFTSVKGNNELVNDVKNLRKELDSLKKSSKNSTDPLIKSFRQSSEAIETVNKSTQLFRKNFDVIRRSSYLGKDIAKPFLELKTASIETVEATRKVASEEKVFEGTLYRVAKAIKAHNNSITASKRKYQELETELTRYLVKAELVARINSQNKGTKYDLTYTKGAGIQIGDVYNVTNMRNAAAALTTFNRTLNSTYIGIRKLKSMGKIFDPTIAELKNASSVFNSWTSQTRVDWITLFRNMNQYSNKFYHEQKAGISDYKQRIESISQSLQKAYAAHERYYASVGAMSTKYWKQIRGNSSYNNQVWNSDRTWKQSAFQSNSIGLQDYLRNVNQINSALTNQTQRTERLRKAQQQLWSRYHTTNLNTYKANMNEINTALERQTTNVRKAGKGLTSFNNGVVQTAHSGRILSNTLYQIRGALLSLKMIFTAMGGMMLWGFAMDIAESVKETVTAKNEMEAQLAQNTKVDASGIQYFRKQLNGLTKDFQKVNKYTVGETVSSIGLEFNLTAKQMADALPIVTMVQSEYVRAGRKTSEAALAVKDILQGEFQRLSRETGVGKEELIAYGWDEDKTNIDGLLKALNKAALDRHWDIFAKKATSLNDVIEITKSRFSELGADIVDSVTPAIVGGFNLIIDSINSLSNAFNGMNAFGKNFTFFGGGLAGLTGILTLLPMVIKGMGLAEISTIGWGKSILTAVFNLNKAEVGLYGFRKALAAVITGTKASELANVRTTKALMGRLLGVKQTTLAEHGYLTALVKSKMELSTYGPVMGDASIAAMNLRQKIIYLAKGELVADKASATWGKTIKSLITSTKLWRIAILGVMSVGFIVWLASVGAWAETVKKRVEAYNDVLSTGKDKIKEYTDDISTYSEQVEKLKAEGKDYSLASRNLNVAQSNKQDMELALKLAKQIKKTDKETAKTHDNTMKSLLNQAYAENGVKNVEKYGQKYQQMKWVAYDIKKSEEERAKFQYQSIQHINEHVAQMKKAGIAEKDRVKYITEYSTKAEEAAQHLKEFNQGNLMSGFYYVLDRFQLAWIDLWNDKDFLNFWEAVKKTFNDIKPTLIWLKDTIIGIGRNLMKFFSTDQGRWVGLFAGLAGGVALLGYKFRGVLGTLKDLGSSIYNRIKDFKNLKKAGKDAGDVMNGDTSTGGITDETPSKTWKKGEFWETVGNDAKNIARKYAKAAVHIALAMGLITEAIALMVAPMGALAGVGMMFKWQEANIKAGIEGLKLIAPTVLALLPPVIALYLIMDKFAPDFSSIVKGAGKAAVAIAAGMLLVAESIFLLNAPLLAIASVGYVASSLGDNVKKGTEAMKIVSDSLQYLVPFIPAFVIGIAMVAVSMTGIGSIVYPVVIAGIATGLLLISGAIVGLTLPLKAIEQLGSTFSNLDGVKKGAEAIKLVADAMVNVEQAIGTLTIVKWELLAGYLADLLGQAIGTDVTTNLVKLTEPDGYFDKLNKFITEFNKFEFVAPIPEKVTALNQVGTGMDTISSAMESVKTAMENIPDEFKNSGMAINYDAETDKTSINTTDVKGYFDTFKEPLRQLKTFIDDFNTSPEFDMGEGISQERVNAINNAGNMISSLNSAVQNVKTVMQGVNSANWEANFAVGGLGEAIDGFFGGTILGDGAGASGDYVSSMGSSFQEMENIIKDMTTFSSHISGLTGGDTSSVDVSGLASIVQQVSTQINNLKTTVSNAVPELKTSSKGLGSAIGDGLLEGFNTKITAITPQLGNKLKTLGTTTLVPNFKQGIDKMSEAMGWELYYVGKAIDDKYDELGEKAYNLAKHMSDRFKDGDDMHSPGIISRTIQDEMGYIGQFLDGGLVDLPQKAFNLANALSSNFNFDLNLSNIQLPDISSFQQGISQIIPTVNNVKTQVSTNFQGMVNNVGTSLTNLKNNATTNYNNIVAKTRTSLSNMQSQTTKNIGGIKTSWKGMQTALITSAETIRSQTQTKINKIKTNMGDFWNKIRHPDQLVAGGVAGSKPKGSIPRSFGGFAGSPIFKQKISLKDPTDYQKEGLLCSLLKGEPCYSGGWNYNWTPKIAKKFKGWNTHFAKFKLDNHLNVGSFENSNFPVKGKLDVFKDYVSEVIGATQYDYYYDSRYSPSEALRRGAFNCWDGTQVILALARAFGIGGGGMGKGTWGKDGHVWATIPGIGIIDPTAIQRGYGFKSPKVKGYSGGSPKPQNTGETHNYNGDIHVNITVNGDDVEVDNRRIDNRTGKQLLDILGINPATGR